MPDRPPPVDLLDFVGDAGRQYVLPEPSPAPERPRRRRRSERHDASGGHRGNHAAAAPVPAATELPTELYVLPELEAEHGDLADDEYGYEYVYVDTGEVVPDGFHHLTGDPETQYVETIGNGASHGRQRAWLACVLVLALVLPALVVTLGYNRDTGTAEAASAPSTTEATVAESSTSAEIATTESTRKRATTTTSEEPTTTSSTEAPTTSTTWGTTSTSAAPATTSTVAYAPVAAAAPPPPPTTAAPTTTAYVPPPTTVAPLGDEASFLACVRQRESGGNYGAVSPDGLYRGAYQFHQATWDNVARMAGRPDLVGVPPNLASPSDQDLLAVTLYRAAGAAPWGGYCA